MTITQTGPEAADAGFDAIKASHGSGNDREKLIRCYRDWTPTYDADVAAQHYRGPQTTAAVVADLLADPAVAAGLPPRDRLRVLDAGCGTGLVGVELRRAGLPHVDGCDLSPEMVAAASRTGAYRVLRGGVDLHGPLDAVFPPAGYDVVTCCGVFTLGHVAPHALDQLVRVVRPGGHVVVSTRRSYLGASGFVDHVRDLERAGRLRLWRHHPDRDYIREEPASYWVFRVLGGAA